MVLFFAAPNRLIYAVETSDNPDNPDIKKLLWLFGEAEFLNKQKLKGFFIGPRKEIITPWSTNAVEITQNMGISGISRIEEFFRAGSDKTEYDPMLQAFYDGLDQNIFRIDKEPDPIIYLNNILKYTCLKQKSCIFLIGMKI